MNPISITHPHAQTAVLLASFHQPDRDFVDRELAVSGTPRSLYALARVLRAAQLMDEIETMHRAHPPIRYDANALGPGLGGIVLDHARAA